MSAEIQLLVGTFRAGPDYKKFGDPYTFTATVIFRDDTVEFIGGTGELYDGFLADLKAAVRDVGFEQMTWERKNPNKRVKFRV